MAEISGSSKAESVGLASAGPLGDSALNL